MTTFFRAKMTFFFSTFGLIGLVGFAQQSLLRGMGSTNGGALLFTAGQTLLCDFRRTVSVKAVWLLRDVGLVYLVDRTA